LEDAIQRASEEFGCSWDRARSLYYRWRDIGERDDAEIVVSRAEIYAELDKLRQVRWPTTLPLNPYAVPAEDLIEVARLFQERLDISFRDALALVGASVEWPNLDALERDAQRDQPEDQP
jgi:hypothetical protein